MVAVDAHGRPSDGDQQLPASLDRIVREPERRKITGICRTSWHVLVREGLAPLRISLTPSGRARGHTLGQLLTWVEERKRESVASSKAGVQS